MGDEQDPGTRFGDLPHGKIVIRTFNAPLGEEHRRAQSDPFGELGHRFTVVDPTPTVFDWTLAHFAVRLLGAFGRSAVPVRIADLLQPGGHHLAMSEGPQDRCCRLAGTDERRDEYFVEVLLGEHRGHCVSLFASQIGERRIDHVQPMTHPLGLRMSHENEFHCNRLEEFEPSNPLPTLAPVPIWPGRRSVGRVTPIDLALVLVRAVFGIFFALHGLNKVRGGLEGTARWFAGIGMRWPMMQARLAASTEIVAGAFFAIGLLTPLAAAAIVGVMVVATWAAHRSNGFFIFNPGQGWEYTVSIAVVALTVGFSGPGEISVDRLLGLQWSGWWPGIAAVVLGVGGGIAQLAVCYRPTPTR